MGVNKIQLSDGEVLVDMSQVSVTPETLAKGETALDASGELIIGTMESGGSSGGEDEIVIDPAKTYIFIHLGESRKSPVLGCCPSGTVTVDWGDGTEPDTLTGTSISTLKYTDPHEYAEPGDYVITLTVDGTMGFVGTSNRCRILCMSSTVSDIDYAYINMIKKVVMGNCVRNIGSISFRYCGALVEVVIPNTITSIGTSAFDSCHALNSVKFPAKVNVLFSGAFGLCYAPTYYDFSSHASVPTLANSAVFGSIADDCEIRVPAALYDEWIAATNWSTYADYIVAV